MHALIGHTGFVGSNLLAQHPFSETFNSSTIHTIAGREFELLVCAGVSGTKWLANKYPRRDLAAIEHLLGNLKTIRCQRFVLISTVDVYRRPEGVDESSPPVREGLHPYGSNRLLVEDFVQQRFPCHHIIRLPALFGPGLKKNFLYDLLNNHCLHWTHRESRFQYYNLERLWQDLEVVLARSIPLVNFTAAPLSARELARELFARDFDNITRQPPLRYDVRSIHTGLWSRGDYMYSREQVLADLTRFVAKYDKTR